MTFGFLEAPRLIWMHTIHDRWIEANGQSPGTAAPKMYSWRCKLSSWQFFMIYCSFLCILLVYPFKWLVRVADFILSLMFRCTCAWHLLIRRPRKINLLCSDRFVKAPSPPCILISSSHWSELNRCEDENRPFLAWICPMDRSSPEWPPKWPYDQNVYETLLSGSPSCIFLVFNHF